MSKIWECLSKTNALLVIYNVGNMVVSNKKKASQCPAILIIDEDASMLELYERTLNQDYQVFTCSTHHDALEMLSTHHPQLVVLEPAIQEYCGWELFQEIKDTYKIPIILCSALDDRKRGMEAGAAAFLIKPVLPRALLQVLKSSINQSSSSQK